MLNHCFCFQKASSGGSEFITVDSYDYKNNFLEIYTNLQAKVQEVFQLIDKKMYSLESAIFKDIENQKKYLSSNKFLSKWFDELGFEFDQFGDAISECLD